MLELQMLLKWQKKWPQAGKAFEEAAHLQLAMGSKHEGATYYVDAGNCYRKGDPNAAVSAIHKAIEIYTGMGRFNIAAKHHITVADIYESELVDTEKSMQNYEQAADYYKGEESNSSANKCLLQVAQFSAILEKYEKAIEIYEQVATSCMDNSLLKYSAKDHFFRASICHMCMDTENAVLAVKKNMRTCSQLLVIPESVKKLLETIKEENVDQFTSALQEYDSISRLDPFITNLLLKVKKQLNFEPELC